jgi:hypothetical protein
MVSTEVQTPNVAGGIPSVPRPTPVESPTWLLVLKRGYVAFMSLLITVLVGNWLAAISGQNNYIKAEERSERAAVVPMPGLTAADLGEGQAVLNPAEAPATRAQLFYLGDSQVFSRPDAPPGALNAAQWVQILLSRQDNRAVRVRIGATPGMDVQEMLLRITAASEEKPRQDDIIVADLALAEFRDLGVRGEITSLATEPPVNSALKSLVSANPDLTDANKTLDAVLNPQEKSSGGGASTKALAERTEDTLQREADRWSFFAQRENLVALGLLRYAQWEHRLLHITSDTRVPTHAEPYRANLQMLELLMRFAQARNIHLILFFGPVRDLEPNPDAPADLARMHRDITGLCQRYAVTCLDYSRVIPEASWADYSPNQRGAFAMMAGQHDFFHFKEEGHKALAEKLISDAGPQILQWSNQAAPAQ